MRKIPTLFQRDDSRRYVTDQVTPGCEWVLAGEGRATRKWDGTCVLVKDHGRTIGYYTRREVKPGKPDPEGFELVEADPITGKRVGWEPWANSSFAAILEPLVAFDPNPPGTYELCGPKINGNPEGFQRHALIPHGAEGVNLCGVPLTFDGLGWWMTSGYFSYIEGIVWHHADGRMAKLKRRDFPSDAEPPVTGG